MNKTRILLVRHGQSEGNVLGLFTGQSGFPLVELGHEQAELTAKHIRKTYAVDAVYSSDLPRAFQTAEHIAMALHLPLKTDCRFREINAGKWERKPFSELEGLFPEDYAVWVNDIVRARCTGGESVAEIAERAVAGILAVAEAHPGQCVVITSHATTIRAALWKILGGTAEAMEKTSFGSNCAISELSVDNGSITLVSAGYAEHLGQLTTTLPSNI